jgi:hypothetical protein
MVDVVGDRLVHDPREGWTTLPDPLRAKHKAPLDKAWRIQESRSDELKHDRAGVARKTANRRSAGRGTIYGR